LERKSTGVGSPGRQVGPHKAVFQGGLTRSRTAQKSKTSGKKMAPKKRRGGGRGVSKNRVVGVPGKKPLLKTRIPGVGGGLSQIRRRVEKRVSKGGVQHHKKKKKNSPGAK